MSWNVPQDLEFLATALGSVLLLILLSALIYWLVKEQQASSPQRSNTGGTRRRPSIYLLPMSEPQPWEAYRVKKPPGYVVPVHFIAVSSPLIEEPLKVKTPWDINNNNVSLGVQNNNGEKQ